MKQSTTFKRLMSYPLSQPKPMLKGLALLFIAALASAGGPWLIQYFIDEHIAKGDYSRDILISLAAGTLPCSLSQRCFNTSNHCNLVLWQPTRSKRFVNRFSLA